MSNEQRIQALRDALQYSTHKADCDRSRRGSDCSCGLDALRQELEDNSDLHSAMTLYRATLLMVARRKQAEAMACLLTPPDDIARAGGGCDCYHCGLTYYDHPNVDGLTVLCDGSMVKL